MRGKAGLKGVTRDHSFYKDSLEASFMDDIHPVKMKKTAQAPASPRSPASIFSSLPEIMPKMEPLPKPVVKPDETMLPVNAVWGGGRKVWTSKREQEILDECLDAEPLLSNAKMQLKTGEKAQRKAKAKHASLEKKFYDTRRARKKVLRDEAAAAEAGRAH